MSSRDSMPAIRMPPENWRTRRTSTVEENRSLPERMQLLFSRLAIRSHQPTGAAHRHHAANGGQCAPNRTVLSRQMPTKKGNFNPMRSHDRAKAALLVCLFSLFGGAMAASGTARADDPAPPYHILSSQDLCNLIWPASQAMPDPAEFGTVCVRHGGVLMRLSRALPAFVANTFALKPGAAVELPVGSARVNPDDPMSDWLIPDCAVAARLDCGT